MAKDLWVTRIFRRVLSERPDFIQERLAIRTGVDRSHISHQLAGRYRPDMNEFDIWCDEIDNDDAVHELCRRRHGRFIRNDRPIMKATDFLKSFNGLLRDAGLAGGLAGRHLEDGHLSTEERIELFRQIDLVRETCESIQMGLAVRGLIAAPKKLRGGR